MSGGTIIYESSVDGHLGGSQEFAIVYGLSSLFIFTFGCIIVPE